MSRGRALGLLGGWLVDAAVGDPRRGHPVAGFGAAAAALERRVHRDARRAGGAYALVLVAGPPLVVRAADRRLGRQGRAALLAAATWAALGARSLGRAALEVAAAVERGDLAAARGALPALVGRDPSALDAAELCRAAAESVAENTVDAAVAPLLWGALAGPAGVVAHRCANTLDAMVGHRSPRYERFGWAAARLDDALAWAPARVTAALAAVLAPAVGGSSSAALSATLRDGRNHPSPNGGRAEAAFAGALGVRLGGTNRYRAADGSVRVEVRGPLGAGAPPDAAAVRRAVRLSRLVTATTGVLAATAAAAGGRRG